jgi:hypothetical protein
MFDDWQSRVTTFYKGAEALAIIARGQCRAIISSPSIEAPKIVAASTIAAEYVARPFDFADLNGKPEPAAWGPVYPKTASAAVSKWRMVANGRELSSDEKRAYGRAVGEWIRGLNDVKPAARVSLKYVMPNYAAKCRAEFAAAAGRDRREWADGKAKSNLVGSLGLTIEQAYAKAMADKAARLEGKAVAPVKRLNEPEAWQPAKPARRPRKRVLEAA